MRKRQRAILCISIQTVFTLLCMCAQAWLYPVPGPVAAFAEGEDAFTVEIAANTPEPTPAASFTTEPSPPPAATPDDSFRVEVLRETTPPPAADKRILIYHTHTWEAYQQDKAAPYRETEKWRTKDENCNVVAVGKALTASLTAMGFTVVHDATAFEPPNLDDAYSRSLAMLEARLAAGERYDLYIDLHRDALASSANIRRTVNIGGEDVARFMVLIGKGTTGGYAEKPDWEANQAIAGRITSSLNGQCEGLARDVKVKTGRFNQHIAPCCVLLECGVNSNTLEEVLRGVPYLAQAIADALQGETSP